MNYDSLKANTYFPFKTFVILSVLDEVLLIIDIVNGSIKGLSLTCYGTKRISLRYIFLHDLCDGNRVYLGTTEIQWLLKRSSRNS